MSLPPLESEPDFRRLLRYLSLSGGFLLALVHAETPLVAGALLAALPRALSERRGQPVRLVSFDPYAGRAHPGAPLEQETALDRVLWPLSEAPPEDRARGVLLIIDGSRYVADDAPAWSYLFARMNEQRNGILQDLSCELLLLGPVIFLDLFARTAPDFWSVRSGEFCEELPQNRPSPLPLDLFLAARKTLPAAPPGALTEAFSFFCSIADPSPDHFLLTSLVRDPWKALGQAIQQVHQGDLAAASPALAQVLATLEALPSESGFAPAPSYFFALHQARLYTAHAVYHQKGYHPALETLRKGLPDDLAATVRPGHLSSFCILQTLLIRALLRRQAGDLPRARADEEEALAQLSTLDPEEEADTWGQMGELLHDQGQQEAAIQSWERQASRHQQASNERAAAIVWSHIGDILEARGQLDEALAIRKNKELPVFQRLGDVREEAITWGNIGDILQARGQLDEALVIRKDKQLPVFQHLGDVRSEAVTWSKIGDILEARGQLDEALAIRKNKELPVFQRLGDVRAEAITWGKIGDFQQRGQLDEALAIRKDKQLPVFQHLGDVRSEAITWGQIGDILEARGQLDEALAIHKDKELPVYQRLGDVRLEAIAWGKIGDILEARGQLDEALAIRNDRELPVFQRLGARRELLVAQAKIAQLLIRRAQGDDLQSAQVLLREALQSAEDMGLPAAEKIRGILSRQGW